ncbi:unnamed protein product [Schistosoma margrebowiei]|uniref:BPTI/Kunitz inhibitor domain-containing protein n=1 Tax=Schistosoma margrebowiei TaxID=48269 RepID=A0A3P8DXF8_9TREM|nr:unnamed protein product [Schistosoma margrebowiei]
MCVAAIFYCDLPYNISSKNFTMKGMFTAISLIDFVVSNYTVEKCFQPLRVGQGTFNLTRFNYDDSKNQSLRFIYKGRRGNGNNFKTKQKCESVCVIKKQNQRKSMNNLVKRNVTNSFKRACLVHVNLYCNDQTKDMNWNQSVPDIHPFSFFSWSNGMLQASLFERSMEYEGQFGCQ